MANNGKNDRNRKDAHSITVEGREDELISAAYNEVERRIREGKATGPELVHFLKAGSVKGRLEKEILEKEKELVTAKTEALQSQKHIEELYAKAIDAMKEYGGVKDDYDD
jgi:hypothetical protein